MNRFLVACALAALLLTSCGALWFAAGAAAVYYGEYYYDDCDDHYHCDDYYYATWNPQAVVANDFDGDGLVDLAVGDGLDGAVWLVRGAERGGAPERRLGLRAVPGQMTLFHAGGEHGAGLLVLGADSGAVEAFAGDGVGGFLALLPAPGSSAAPGWARIARGRLDADDADDVVYVDALGAVHVALGRGDGTFGEAAAPDPAAEFLGPLVGPRLAGVHVAVAEFDGEPGGDLLVVDGDRARLAVFPGRGDGGFEAGYVSSFLPLGDVLSIAPVTLDPEGPADLAVLFGGADAADESTLAVVFPADGTFLVEARPVGPARSLYAHDLDGDGLSDLLLSYPTSGTIRTLRARRR